MLWQIFWLSVVTDLATGLGALPFFFLRKGRTLSRVWLGIGNATAAGFMLGASGMLFYDGLAKSPSGMIIGVIVGAIFIWVSSILLKRHDNVSISSLKGATARTALLVIGILTVHSLAEGIAIGVSFGDGNSFGLLITLALAIHNIPEGLAISLTLVPRGASAWSAVWWSIFSSIPQVLAAVPAFLFVDTFRFALAPGLGFAAGAMLWLTFHELIPEAKQEAHPMAVSGIVAVGAILMLWASGVFS